jgi:serine/threonine protein kinase
MEILRGPEPAEGFSSEPECRQALPKIKRIGETVSSSSGPSKKSVAEDELFLPQKLGEYLLLERIGGNMGAVYKALHTTMDRLVAMKVLPARALANQQAIARFQREMKAVGRLEHPNIVRAYDAREIDGKHVLVMEFVEGRDLSDVVGSSGSLTPADACEVVRQAAVGLQYVHEKGLVHRDVKPSNLMLTAEGQVKILDLGLARFRAREPDEAEMTGSGDVVGTANYMAPEQVTGSHKVDARADVYGLGCTLYKLLSGHAPFDDPKHQDTYDILTAHLSEPVPSIQEIRPDVPDELAAILNRMLAKSPSDLF